MSCRPPTQLTVKMNTMDKAEKELTKYEIWTEQEVADLYLMLYTQGF